MKDDDDHLGDRSNPEQAGGGAGGGREGETPRQRPTKPEAAIDLGASGRKIRAMLRAQLGEEVFTHWFNSLEFDRFDGHTLFVSVAEKFLRNWLQSHYLDELLQCASTELKSVDNIDISVRQPGAAARAKKVAPQLAAAALEASPAQPRPTPIGSVIGPRPQQTTTVAAGFEGSPIDPRYTFDSFECAIHKLAPLCAECGLRIIGHGVEENGLIFCCANCAGKQGATAVKDRAS